MRSLQIPFPVQGGLGEIIGRSTRVEIRAALLCREELDGLQLDKVKGELLMKDGTKSFDDRELVLELGGRGVVGVDNQDWVRLKPHLPDPCPAVIASLEVGEDRVGSCPAAEAVVARDIQGDIAMIQSKLEERLAEGRGLGSELGREKMEKEEEEVKQKKLKLRIVELEEKAAGLQRALTQVLKIVVKNPEKIVMFQVRDSLASTLNSQLAGSLDMLQARLGPSDSSTSGVWK